MLPFIALWEIVVLGGIILLGSGFILFGKKVDLIFVAFIILIGATYIVYSDHAQYLEEQFVIDSFKTSHTIECGLWRGEHILIDQRKGWHYDERLGFVKEDTIFSEPSLCNVVDVEPPLPPVMAYAGVLILTIIALFSIRALIEAIGRVQRGEDESD